MLSKLVALVAVISAVVAHGTVTGIVADGIFYEGYNPSYQYANPQPITVGWKTPEDLSNGFVPPSSFQNPDIICHLGATNAQIAAPVKGGGKVEFQWTPWPTSHKGPVIDYLANCRGPCETVNKTTLKWFKIDQLGLLGTTITDGNWASDTLITNNNSWTSVIPTNIISGNYVIRHEIIALHAAQQANGAQNYPQCFNLAIKTNGTVDPPGVLATTFYKATDPGILYDLYAAKLAAYTIPGPTLYSGALSVTQTLPPKPTASASGVYTLAK